MATQQAASSLQIQEEFVSLPPLLATRPPPLLAQRFLPPGYRAVVVFVSAGASNSAFGTRLPGDGCMYRAAIITQERVVEKVLVATPWQNSRGAADHLEIHRGARVKAFPAGSVRWTSRRFGGRSWASVHEGPERGRWRSDAVKPCSNGEKSSVE